ncbi:uncharacterized protein PV09_06083 [Verruconis gallopava]|uniref:Major facilitator superfamily (MFS) profile domain-containing protein n=1 Tax=Verruconis gallopava TaxID=253628 RepID=A0A0D2AU38_9PEZI|nr:uncharacterized protein PV09_06083 [Verruconis gallopava]KIW02644.1 hypothetical protein PV09_06083 [Verruconis gallopava]
MAVEDREGARNNALDERTPLLRNESKQADLDDRGEWSKSVVYRILLCALMVSLSFGVTQVPLIYVFRVMTCQAYYDTHTPPSLATSKDRCSMPAIEASTAKSVALLGASTTLFGLINLFITGWLIKRIGVKSTLLIQVFWPAVRLLIQNIGVMSGGSIGIIIVQCSQIITIIGGPNGYLLALNSFITEVVKPEQRTPSLGRLQGAMFFGTSIGYLIGGEISERFGIIWPFRVTLCLFCLSTLYVAIGLPWIRGQEEVEARAKIKGIRRFFGPLKVFAPQRLVLLDGRTKRDFGPILLAFGVYLGILATGYIPTLLQMYSTDIYGFGTRENGFLISLNSMLRGVFLTFLFPRIIAFGRRKVSQNKDLKTAENGNRSDLAMPFDPEEPSEVEITDTMDNEQEPLQPPNPPSKQETYEFDLIYARYSLLLDGILTGAATFIQKGWQIYLVAIILPFASGTGAASKGTILQMSPPSERTDALGAITLVENIARLTTTSIFGLVFAAFASIEKTYLVFTINAAVALVGFLVLCFAQFPPDGSQRQDRLDSENE